MNKKSGTCFLAVALVLVLAFSSLSFGQPPVVRVGYNKLWTSPALLVGKNKGFFEGKGIDVRWVSLDSPPQVIEGIASRNLEVGVVTDPPYVVARERGVKFMAVALMGGPEQPSSGYMVLKETGIKKIEDLKGKIVAVNNYSGNFDLFLRYMLVKHGLTPMKDVQIVEIPLGGAISALIAKKVHATALNPLLTEVALERFGDKVEVLFDYYALDINKDGWNTMTMVMTTDFISKRRDVAKAFMKAYLESVRYYNEDEKRAVQAWAQEAGTPLVTKMKKAPYIGNDAKLNVKGMENTVTLLKQFGFIKTTFKTEELIDHSIIDEVMGGK